MRKNARMHVMRFLVPGTQQMVAFKLRVTDAKAPVTLPRTMLDAVNGKPGSVVECMDAVCAGRQKDFFPHPYFFIEVTRSRAFVVSKKNREGIATDCVRYNRPPDEAEETRRYDQPGGKKQMIRDGLVEKDIHFLVPRLNTSLRRLQPHPDDNRIPGKTKAMQIPRGAWARAFEARKVKRVS